MRYVMFGAMCFLVFLFSLEMILTVNARNSRKDELDQAVTWAVSNTMEKLAKGKINGAEELEEVFREQLDQLVNSETQLTVEILAKDAEKGLLSVNVEEVFVYPGGKTGRLAVCKTAILDETVPGEEGGGADET